MRATRHSPAPTAPVDDPTARRDVIVRPAPLAMVWQGPGSAHAAIAVPGVSLGPGDVLVAVESATICPADAATVGGQGKPSVPLVLGHEQVGRVAAVGHGASTADGARLIVGMRVVWSRRIGCGTCEACRADSPSACRTAREYGADRLRRGWELSGGFATHVLVRAGTAIVAVPEIVPVAALAPAPCGTSLAAAAVEAIVEATDVDGEEVVVFGADLVGLTVTAMLTDEGARVTVVDGDPERRAWARRFGAARVGADVAALADGRRVVAVVDADPLVGASALVAAVARVGAVASVGAAPSGALQSRAALSAVIGPDGAHPDPAVSGHAHEGDGDDLDAAVASIPLAHGGIVVRVRHAHDSAAVPLADRFVAHGTDRIATAALDADGDERRLEAPRARTLTVRRPDPRHLATAVVFLANAWYRFPLADLVAVRFPLGRLDEALTAAGGRSALRVGIDPVVP